MENTSSNNHSAVESSPAAATTSNGQAAPALTNGHSHVVNEQNAALLPQLETFERMMKLPVVEAAWHQSQDVYGKVKGYNAVFGWALRTAEDAVHIAVTTAAPLVQKLDGPIQYVDQTLVTGIEKLEAKAPIIKEQPIDIYNQARSRVVDIVQPQIQKVCSLKSAGQQKAASLKSAGQQKAASLKELSWQKANEVLATQYGSMAVTGVDTTSALAERLLDYYFPKSDADDEDENSEYFDASDDLGLMAGGAADTIARYSASVGFACDKDQRVHDLVTNEICGLMASVAAGSDPVLHTCQTVGRLSNKVASRVYRTVSRQVKLLKKEDVHEYVASLIAVLRLTQYLNFINEKVQTSGSIASTSSEETTTEATSNNHIAAEESNNHNSLNNHTSTEVEATTAQE